MVPSDEMLERAKPEVTGLESYRRLIELQKQMIALSQHHERARRECEALRATVAREVAEQARGRQSAVAQSNSSGNSTIRR